MITDHDLTLRATRESQGDLDLLCTNRPLVTCEIFTPNAYYGQDLILKRWAGLPDTYPLKIALPHSIETEIHGSAFSRHELVPVVTYYYEPKRFERQAEGHRHVWPMASPYLYAMEMSEAPTGRTGTIFFPNHSDWKYRSTTDYEELGDRLLKLPDRYHPITVNVYFIDYWQAVHEPLLERGIRVTSAGSVCDPLFLVRLQHLCRMHEFSSSNDISAPIFYSIAAGCTFVDLGASEATWSNARYKDNDAGVRRIRSLVEDLTTISQVEQKRVADAYLGRENVVGPSALAACLHKAEMIDKYEMWSGFRGRTPWPFVMPRALRRWVKSLITKAHGSLGRSGKYVSNPPSTRTTSPNARSQSDRQAEVG